MVISASFNQRNFNETNRVGRNNSYHSGVPRTPRKRNSIVPAQSSFLAKDAATSQVENSRFWLAELDERPDVPAHEKIFTYFDNIEDDIDILFDTLPAIDIARHMAILSDQSDQLSTTRDVSRQQLRHRISWKDESEDHEADEENFLRKLIDENVELAWAVTKSLRNQEINQLRKNEKPPEAATAKLFETEIHTLLEWRNLKKERVTQEMKTIILGQAKRFKGKNYFTLMLPHIDDDFSATDDVSLLKMTPGEQMQFLERFQDDNKALQQIVDAREV